MLLAAQQLQSTGREIIKNMEEADNFDIREKLECQSGTQKLKMIKCKIWLIAIFLSMKILIKKMVMILFHNQYWDP